MYIGVRPIKCVSEQRLWGITIYNSISISVGVFVYYKWLEKLRLHLMLRSLAFLC